MSSKTEADTALLKPYLSLMLGNELFAIGVASVLEILEVPDITRVPNAPEYMKGVINLRGNVLPLVDTKIKFGLPKIELTLDTCIIVIEIEIDNELTPVGVLVDRVLEVLEVDESTIQSSPIIDASYPLSFIKGMITVDESYIMLLNINEVFSVQEKQTLKTTK